MKALTALLGTAIVAGVVFAIVAGVGHLTQPAVSAMPNAHWTGAYPAQEETMLASTTLDIEPVATGEHVALANFAIRPGHPVTLTVHNYTRESHTFTSQALNLHVTIKPGSPTAPRTTVFTINAPYGIFDWHCTVCPGDMQGKIYAIVGARSV